ncbi:MAG: adenosylcobinamide-GDP ribazoletransferase [Candidatus Binatia bacterium]
MQGVVAALKYLTVWGRLSAMQPTPEAVGAAAAYFPLVGLLLGLLLAIVNYGLSLYLDSGILSIFLVAILFAATAGIHLDGTRHTFDAMVYRMMNQRTQTCGVVAVLFVVLFKIAATNAIDERIALSLFLAPIASRWALVLCLYGYHDRCEETPKRIAENVKFWHLLTATAVTLGLAVYLLGRKGLWLGLALAIFTLLIRSLLHRQHAVLTEDNFGAVIELSEVLGLILLASL